LTADAALPLLELQNHASKQAPHQALELLQLPPQPPVLRPLCARLQGTQPGLTRRCWTAA